MGVRTIEDLMQDEPPMMAMNILWRAFRFAYYISIEDKAFAVIYINNGYDELSHTVNLNDYYFYNR